MTDCSNVEVRELLPDLLHDRLDAASRAGAQAHVAGCATCAAELELLRRSRQVMQRAPAVDVQRIVAALPRPVAAPQPVAAPALVVSRGASSRRTVRSAVGAGWRPYAVAAGLLLAAGLSGVTLLRPTSPAPGAEGVVAAGTPGVAAPAEGSVAVPTTPGAAGAAEPLLAVNVEGLSDADFAGLLDELNDLEAMPASEPVPVVRVERDGAGGD